MTTRPRRVLLALAAGVAGIIPASAQTTPPRPSPPPAAPLVQVVIRAQGTGERYPATYSFLCEEGLFCTAIFDVTRRRPEVAAKPDPDRIAPINPVRIEIGVWSRPEGEVTLVAITTGRKLMLNCSPSQTIRTKGRTDAPRIRYSVHEPDPACGGGAERAPPDKAIAAIEVVVRPAALLRGQPI